MLWLQVPKISQNAYFGWEVITMLCGVFHYTKSPPIKPDNSVYQMQIKKNGFKSLFKSDLK